MSRKRSRPPAPSRSSPRCKFGADTAPMAQTAPPSGGAASAPRAQICLARRRRPARLQGRIPAQCAGPLLPSGVLDRLAEIGCAHLRIRQQVARIAGQRDLAAFHHVAAMAHFERQLRVLLDQQDGDAFAGDRRAPSRTLSAPSAARAPSTARRAAAASAATSARGPSRASAARRPTACRRSAGAVPSGAETGRRRARCPA